MEPIYCIAGNMRKTDARRKVDKLRGFFRNYALSDRQRLL